MPQKYISPFPGHDAQRRRASNAHHRSRPEQPPKRVNKPRCVAGVLVSADVAEGVESRCYWVNGMNCSWTLVEAGAMVAMGKHEPGPGPHFTGDPDFCKRCLVIYNQQAKKMTEINEKIGLDVDGRPIKQEDEMAKQKNFVSYIDDLADIYHVSRVLYSRAAKKLQNAQDYLSQVQDHYRNNNSPIAQAEIAVAQQRLKETQDEHRSTLRDLNTKHVDKIRELRNQLQEAAEAYYRVDPSQIDANGVALLNSGALRPADIKAMTDTYADNPTMLRLISAEAKRQIDTTPFNRFSTQDRFLLMHIADQYSVDGQGGGSNELKIFDEMTSTMRYGLQDNSVLADKMDTYVRSTFDVYKSRMDGNDTRAGDVM